MAKVKKKINAKQTKAIALLVAGQTQEQAALGAGVRSGTMTEWLRDSVFQDELRLALERMRQTFEGRVFGLANNASVVVADMIEDKEDKGRQLEGAKLAFNAAVRLSGRYKELQVDGHIAPAQPLVIFPPGTQFPWASKAIKAELPEHPLEIPEDVSSDEIVDAETVETEEKD